ncbi:unnamed protein product [Thelazia callipaeda]|uniref:INCENP_ARK-bind domain-containing protein n=1 Tax=Thelazia callipaeda TaxID=103827 RepID=A0A0N5CUL5_THECL|nr:unnamed protein product [Thelazia callipaeda]
MALKSSSNHSVCSLHAIKFACNFGIFRICRSSSHSYPYPRTHTLVVIPPSRQAVENGQASLAKSRPPLNRAIPPIPESKSNDSIMTQISEKHSEIHAGSITPSTSKVSQELLLSKSVAGSISSPTTKEAQIHSQDMEKDRSLVIENSMAQNLASKTAVIVSSRSGCSNGVPRSPLMSVAHSVRSKLTKLGNRLSRTDGNQNIRASASLSSIRRDPAEIARNTSSNMQFKKSVSMETRTLLNSSCSEPNKVISSKESSRNSISKASRIPGIRFSSNNINQSTVEVYEKDSSSNREKYSEVNRSKILPTTESRDETKGSVMKGCKEHLKPQTAKDLSLLNNLRQLNKSTGAVPMKTGNCSSVKETMKPSINTAKTESVKCVEVENAEKCQIRKNDQKKSINSKQKSFIPLYTTPPRRLPVKKSDQAPLAECESSCVENSPAVEVSLTKFVPSKSDEAWKGNEENQMIAVLSPSYNEIEITSATKSVREFFPDFNNPNIFLISNKFLSSETCREWDEASSKQSLHDGKICDRKLIDIIPSGDLHNVPSVDDLGDSDGKSGDSTNEFISPTIMTSSGFTTSSGFQDSPEKSPDKEIREQFLDMTNSQVYEFLKCSVFDIAMISDGRGIKSILFKVKLKNWIGNSMWFIVTIFRIEKHACDFEKR